MSTPKPAVKVEVGQIWADTSWHEKGRTIRIVEIDATHAVTEVVTEADQPYNVRSTVGRRSRIAHGPRGLRGYRLATDEPEAS